MMESISDPDSTHSEGAGLSPALGPATETSAPSVPLAAPLCCASVSAMLGDPSPLLSEADLSSALICFMCCWAAHTVPSSVRACRGSTLVPAQEL